MKSKFGIETDGKYLKYYNGYLRLWVVETKEGIRHFDSEMDADGEVVKIEQRFLRAPAQKQMIYQN